MHKTLGEIAELIGGTVLGDSGIAIEGITNIEDASENYITFAIPPHLEKASKCAAAAVIIPDSVEEFAKPAVRVDNPRMAFIKLLEYFTPKDAVKSGVHPTAVVGDNVSLGANVAVMANVYIGDNVCIGDNTIIYPNASIGRDVTIGAGSIIYSNVTIYAKSIIGSKVILQAGSVIGSDGFGFVTYGGQHHKVPHVGNVVIEDRVEIGANVTIDRGTTGSTVIGCGTKIDNLVHIAHNVIVGENCFFVAFTGISGSTKIGNNVTFAGQSGSVGHITIGNNCVFAGKSGVTGNVPDNSFYAGFPARPHKEWLKNEAAQRKIPAMLKRLQEMEGRLQELERKDK